MRNKSFLPAILFRKLLLIPEATPRFVQIEITNCCNLNCPMCIRNFVKLPIRHMDFDVFRRVIDRLQGVETVTLAGYGEPLLHPRIHDAIRYCHESGKRVQITTNGLLLDTAERRTALLDSGLDALSFSVESIDKQEEIGHDNHRALENIQEFLVEKTNCGITSPEITIQTLMLHGRNRDLFDVIAWGARHGADRINVVRFDLNSLASVRRPNRAEEKDIFRELNRLRRAHRIRIDCIQDRFFGGFRGLLYKYGKYLMGLDRHCVRLQNFTYVNVDGRVRPCCALVGHELGNLLEEDLQSIWRSHRYNTFRKRHDNIPWCSKCDTFTLQQKG